MRRRRLLPRDYIDSNKFTYRSGSRRPLGMSSRDCAKEDNDTSTVGARNSFTFWGLTGKFGRTGFRH